MSVLFFESKLCRVQLLKNAKLNNVLLVMLGALGIAVATQITIPLAPVPMTLQTFAVLFISMVLGAKEGSKAVLLYLFAGICGMPVFSHFSYGLLFLLGSTGGYLIGFVFAVWVSGHLFERGWAKNRASAFFALLLGDSILFITGYLGLSRLIGFHQAYLLGIAHFYGVEAIKLFILSMIAPACWQKK